MKPLSRVRLFTTPWTAAHQAPPSMGFSRQEYWSGVPVPSPLHVRLWTKCFSQKKKISFIPSNWEALFSTWKRGSRWSGETRTRCQLSLTSNPDTSVPCYTRYHIQSLETVLIQWLVHRHKTRSPKLQRGIKRSLQPWKVMCVHWGSLHFSLHLLESHIKSCVSTQIQGPMFLPSKIRKRYIVKLCMEGSHLWWEIAQLI